MKKLLALILSLIMILSVLSLVAMADGSEKIDHRRLDKYGQMHYYLGEPIEPTAVPDANDGIVSEGEYVHSVEFSISSSKDLVGVEEYAGYSDTEWVKMYMSHDAEKFYLAFEVKDKVYYPAHDYFMICIGARDGGRTIEGVSRVRYDFMGDATNGTLVGSDVKTGVGAFYKNDDGSWGTASPVDFNKHVGDRSLSWDSERKIITLEAVFDIQTILDYWDNDKSIEDAELYFFPTVNMGGGKVAGSSDLQYQGRLVHYFNTTLDPEIHLRFTLDYPEINYWFGWAAHIVRFCEKPAVTTEAPTSTGVGIGDHACTTTAPPSVIDPSETVKVKVTLETDETTLNDNTTTPTTTVENSKGCGATLSIAAISVIPLCAVVAIKKKKDDK